MTSVGWLLIAAAAQAAPVSFDFETTESVAAWTVTGPAAAAALSNEADRVRAGKGSLVCTYTGQPGAPLSLSTKDLDITGVQSLSLSLKASSQAPFVLILAEEDGSLYHTFATCPGGPWCDVGLPLSDFQLQDDSTDENAALDVDQVRTFTLQELANMPGEFGPIFGMKPGEQWVALDDVRFLAEAKPSHSRVEREKVLVEDFERPWLALLPVGGAQFSRVAGPDGGEPSALAIGFTFAPAGPAGWPGVVAPVGHVDLTGARALRLRVRAPGPAKLHLLLEEQDGTRYETKAVVPEADEWQARDYALGDFTLEPGRTDENGALDLDQLRVAIVVMDAWNALLDEQERGQFELDDVLFLK